MEQWKEYQLGDLLNFRRGHDLPKSEMIAGDIPVAGSNGVIGLHNEATPVSPCITIGRSGNVGTPNFYEKCWAHNTVLYIDDFKENNPEFLFYLLKTIPLKSFGGGSAVPTLNRNHIHPIVVKSTKDIKLQQKIVTVLKSLDDKIELNRQINDNLEQQAQALFKSWFVDFEPFKDGEFVDSELGMIPKGWRVGTLSELSSKMISGDWGKETLIDNYTRQVFCIRGADIPDIKVGNRGKMPIRFILEKNYNNKSLTPDDLVVEISGGSPTQSTGRICQISSELISYYNNSIICTNFCKAISPIKGYSAFVYYLWNMLYDQGVMFLYENGTTGIKNLDISGLLDKHLVIIPTQEIATAYSDTIKKLTDKILSNSIESANLSQLRDTLLPRLMSGELKINEINC